MWLLWLVTFFIVKVRRRQQPSAMSSSPEASRDWSPPIMPTQPDGVQGSGAAGSIEIVVHSVMDGVKDAKIMIPTDATLFEMKRHITMATGVSPERQLLLYKDKELKDDDSPISSYDITKPCTIIMNVKMNTGVKTDQIGLKVAEIMCFLPMLMPSDNLSDIRNKICTMTDIQERKQHRWNPVVDENSSKWTPAKQLEHQLTRNRMKMLLRKRKRTAIRSYTPPQTPGSVISRSPAESPPRIELAGGCTSSPNKNFSMIVGQEISEKELKCFFEPPECLDELLRKRDNLFLPAESELELEEIKEKRRQALRTTCKVCDRKLTLYEQQIHCLCRLVFCNMHREPSAHLCQIDYKHRGRREISKGNPRVDSRSARKAQLLK
ncbi:hypothetical protein RB195_012049 [Necator americanus]|uniref:Ubiquitin-like domain-containing protein n=1 Tax=Necator americanus TaxID=51031 RepID=A0ABR1D683_NECAM